MIKRIEFTLNLDDPQEAALFRALKPALQYRRAGALIRQALVSFLKVDISSGVVQQSRQNLLMEDHHE